VPRYRRDSFSLAKQSVAVVILEAGFLSFLAGQQSAVQPWLATRMIGTSVGLAQWFESL